MKVINMFRLLITFLAIKFLLCDTDCNSINNHDECKSNSACKWQNYGRYNCVNYPCNERTKCDCKTPCYLNENICTDFID